MVTIVIRSFTKELVTGSGCYEWSITQASRNSYGQLFMFTKLVTKAKARKTIEDLGLVESYSTRDGEIFDTPEGDFKALFPQGIRTFADKMKIEQTDRL